MTFKEKNIKRTGSTPGLNAVDRQIDKIYFVSVTMNNKISKFAFLRQYDRHVCTDDKMNIYNDIYTR